MLQEWYAAAADHGLSHNAAQPHVRHMQYGAHCKPCISAHLECTLQIQGGAEVLNLKVVAGNSQDGIKCMVSLVKLMATHPEISRVPFMLSSMEFDAMQAGLECCQGRAIANSISLRDGELLFREHAAIIKTHGAAVVVLACVEDEEGQVSGWICS